MIKFTKEEISLCKQVAEKERKPFKWGDWYYFKKKVHLIWSKPEPIMDDSCVPLWTISDCLEFLEKEGYGRIIGFIHFDNGCWTFTTENIITSNNYKKARGEKANTKLEACLKAVLEILK